MRLKDTIIWRNLNTDTVEQGTVHSLVDNTLAIGDFRVSWVDIDDIEVIETVKKGKEIDRINKNVKKSK